MKKFLLGMLAFIPSVMLAQYSGKVFVDDNQNGVFDKGEKLLKDIRVSDGLHVVETSADGAFTLPGHELEKFIFITLPSGYMAPDNYYKRIDKDMASYDFALVPYDNGTRNRSFRFIQITDTEIGGIDDHEKWVHDLYEYSRNEEVAFVIHTGDICYENGLKNHIKIMNTRQMERPVFYCIGNHDLVKGKYGEELFESIYGPVFYSFDVENVHYIVTPMVSGDYAPGYTVDEVCRWMKNDLAHVRPGTPIYVFNHDLLSYDDNFLYKGAKESVNLNEYNLKAWIYGHWHINLMKKQGKVCTVSTGTIDKGGVDHSSNTYRVMTVDGNGDFTSDIRHPHIHRYLHIASPVKETSSGTITVNTYSSVSYPLRVTYSCLWGDKVLLKDKPLSRQTDWTWSADLSLDKQYYNRDLRLIVKTEFRNGEVSIREQQFKYNPEAFKVKPEGNWTNLAGNASHTGGVVASSKEGGLHLAWTKNVGGNIFMTSPVVYNGKVFTASVDENLKDEAAVFAYDAVTGNRLWKYKVKGSIKNTIAVDKGRVFAQDVYGNVYALDCEHGSLCWEKDFSIGTLPSLVEGLCTKEGIVYVGSGYCMSALDAETGKVIWQNKDWKHNQGTVVTLSVSDEVVLGGSNWTALYCNDVKTGKMLWNKSADGLRFRSSSPVIRDGRIYLLSSSSFFILDALSGDIIVKKDLPYALDGASSPLLTDDAIIFGTSRNGLVALDRKTLTEKWNCPLGKALVYTVPYTSPDAQSVETTPVLVGNTVYVTASDGCVYAIDKSSGKVLDHYAVGSPIFGSVAVSGNTLFVTDLGGNIYAFCLDKSTAQK